MSSVSNVIVAYGVCGAETDEELLAEINRECDSGRLVLIGSQGKDEKSFHNGKCFEVNIAAGAFNGLDAMGWIFRVRNKVSFESHQCNFCQFMVMDQENDGFGLFEVYRSLCAEKAWDADGDIARKAEETSAKLMSGEVLHWPSGAALNMEYDKAVPSFYSGSVHEQRKGVEGQKFEITIDKAFEFLNFSQDKCKEMVPRLQAYLDGLLGEGSVVVEVGALELIVSTSEVRCMYTKKPSWCWCPVKFKYTVGEGAGQ